MIAGIDEVNKGQVIGPIFVSICYTQTPLEKIPKVLDSKRKKNLDDLEYILERHNIKCKTEVISLDQLNSRKINHLITEKMKTLIVESQASEVYVDSHYQKVEKLERDLDTSDLVTLRVSHRADESNSLVALASLVALRAKMDYLRQAEKTYGPLGSGNLTDPKTICFLRRHHPDIPLLKKRWSLRSVFPLPL